MSLYPTIHSSMSNRYPEVKAFFTSDSPIPKKIKSQEKLEVTAQGVFVLDLHSGHTLYEKNPHKRLKPASLTKIMTSLVALDYYKDDTILSVINAYKSVGSKVDFIKNDQIMAKNALEGLLISSGNDAAVTLAENYPGGYTAFIKQMNSKALNMGLQNTHFSNVSGVESSDHYTSAYDISMIAKAALDRSIFESIVSQKQGSFKSLKGHTYTFKSTNILLNKPGYFGVKTGWTPEAGECLVILVDIDNQPLLVSLLNSKDRFGEAEQIVDWVYKNYIWE